MFLHNSRRVHLITSLFLSGLLIFQLFQQLSVQAKGTDFVMISCNQTTMKIGDEYALLYLTYSGKKPNFKSSKSSIASVNTYGIITAKKAGTAKITAKVKGFEAYCFVTVLPTTIKLSGSSVSLYKGQTYQLKATTSTGRAPTFKSSKSSVATVEEDGTITAIKHGSAIIKVSCDNTKMQFQVLVKKPTIQLSASTLTLKPGQSVQMKANVSSGNPVHWSVSNINILDVTDTGLVTARQKGKAYLYATKDGVKVSCIIKVIEPKKKKK